MRSCPKERREERRGTGRESGARMERRKENKGGEKDTN
jgi:hypothetical protein